MSNVRYIYGLYDVREPDVVMVVGETKLTLRARLQGYIDKARRGKNLPSLQWVRKLLADGVRPRIRLLATTNEKNWRKCERRFISIWRKKNPSLLNMHRGGNGKATGKRKIFCDKCGSKRKHYKNQVRFCPQCQRAWRRAYRHTSKRRAYARDWRRSAYQNSPKFRARSLAYARDWHHANKLGLTVSEYRQQRTVDHTS